MAVNSETLALIGAVYDDDIKAADEFIKLGANVNYKLDRTKNENGMYGDFYQFENQDTVLFLAISNGSLDMVKLLIAKSDLTHVNEDKTTALMIAVEENHPDIVQELLKYPVIFDGMINKKNADGETALSIAVNKMRKRHKGAEHLVELLKKATAGCGLTSVPKLQDQLYPKKELYLSSLLFNAQGVAMEADPEIDIIKIQAGSSNGKDEASEMGDRKTVADKPIAMDTGISLPDNIDFLLSQPSLDAMKQPSVQSSAQASAIGKGKTSDAANQKVVNLYIGRKRKQAENTATVDKLSCAGLFSNGQAVEMHDDFRIDKKKRVDNSQGKNDASTSTDRKIASDKPVAMDTDGTEFDNKDLLHSQVTLVAMKQPSAQASAIEKQETDDAEMNDVSEKREKKTAADKPFSMDYVGAEFDNKELLHFQAGLVAMKQASIQSSVIENLETSSGLFSNVQGVEMSDVPENNDHGNNDREMDKKKAADDDAEMIDASSRTDKTKAGDKPMMNHVDITLVNYRCLLYSQKTGAAKMRQGSATEKQTTICGNNNKAFNVYIGRKRKRDS